MSLFGFSWRRGQGNSSPRGKKRPSRCFLPSVERLEDITLLSANVASLAQTMYVRFDPSGQASPLDGSSATGLTPAKIRHAYGFDQLSYTGAGQTIAIIDAYDAPNIASDLHAFDVKFGLSDPTFTKVNQTGSTTGLPTADSGWAMEISLDVEWAHALAPGAAILLVEANDANTDNLFAAANWAAAQPGVSVVSMSFGAGEYNTQLADDSTFLNHPGVTFVGATGDAGSPANYPAFSPYVLAVGGTTLTLSSSGAYTSESAWSGTGGGISQYEAKPSFQSSLPYSNRAVPDVAFDADPNSGVSVYDSYSPWGFFDPYNPNPPWSTIGGTSLAAPSWAAIIALANQARVQAGRTTLTGTTQTLPAIYSLPSSDFHDITTGGNNQYQAAAGYDLVTGRGSPIVNLLVPALSGPIVTLGAAAGNAQVSLSWTGVTGASSYSIYRGTTPNGEGTSPITSGLTGTSYTDTSVTDGTTYYYTVSAISSTGTVLAKSNEASATPVAPPLAVTNLVATPAFDQVTLSWTASTGATSYNIYRGTSPNGEGSTPVETVTGTTATDVGLVDGSTYYYKVIAVNAGGQSPQSSEVSATPRVTPPSGLTATPSATTVTLAWTASPGAITYNVYRGTSANGEGATPIATGITGTAFTDAGLTLGVKYYYEVTAVESIGESARTGEVSATTVLITNASIWNSSATPANADVTDNPVELGVQFESSVSGYITGLRFYKGGTDFGSTHVGSLWTASGTLLATATFTNESDSGWQTVSFSAPVAISANTVYVAGYFASTGHFADTLNYFSSSGTTNGVLSALSNSAAAGGNGLYSYGNSSVFPTSSHLATNYWVDVLFTNAFLPAVVSETPAPSATQVPANSSVTVTFNESVAANSISFQLLDPNNNVVAATLSYNDSTHTATLTPNAALAANTTYTAIVSGATATGGLTMNGSFSWSFTTTGPILNASIWSSSATPANTDVSDSPVELGVQFESSVSGYITGLRFYKGGTDFGSTHVGSLWTASGTLLATATFTNESDSGWQTVSFSAPVAISANTVYVAGYFASTGHFADTLNYFSSSGVTNGVLTALSNSAAAGGNGLYGYGSSSVFPTNSHLATNYWVDVVFSSVLVPSVVSETPASGATQVSANSSVTATFSESVVASSISFVLKDSANNTVAASVSYNDSTHTVTLTPNAALAANATYTATISGATDANGLTMNGSFSWSFTTTGPILNASIWSSSATPANTDVSDSPVELGVQFESSVSGYITGLRFYKGGTDFGSTHVGSLWTASGTLLATATFTNESDSGWQTVSFSAPVAITANTVYVAGYFASAGHFADTLNYFSSSGVTNGALTALSNSAAAGGNGLYGYGSSSVFPTNSHLATNYWVDVVFSTVLVPRVVSETPAPGATQVSATGSVTATFSESVTANSISFQLLDPSNHVVAATLSYNDSTHTATLTPNAALAANTTYTAIISGATDAGGLTMNGSFSWSFTTTGPIINASIWSPSATPANPDVSDNPVELGVKFESSVSGYITGIRFYKSGTDAGSTHVGSLWTSDGTLLATATFTSESDSGWQQVNFATPVAITANTVYVTGYFASTGHFADSLGYFSSSGVTNGVLTALSNSAGGGNGVYGYGSSSVFPTNSANASNYWVDVVFGTQVVPAVASETPVSGATQVSANSSVSVTFNESVSAGSISFVLRDSANNTVAATVSYNDSTHTVTLTPNAALAANATYTATISGATDASGYSMNGSFSWSFTTAAPITNASIWSPSATPANTDVSDSPVELGVKFESSVNGYITGLRFYKGSTDFGSNHVGSLWTADGTLLATATFTNESNTGWQQVSFSTPVAISANTVYVAGYFAYTGHFADTLNYFSSSGVTNGVLTALSNSAAGGNGVYGYGSSSVFPTNSNASANYWVDVVFSTVVPSIERGSSSSAPATGGTAGSHKDGAGNGGLTRVTLFDDHTATVLQSVFGSSPKPADTPHATGTGQGGGSTTGNSKAASFTPPAPLGHAFDESSVALLDSFFAIEQALKGGFFGG